MAAHCKPYHEHPPWRTNHRVEFGEHDCAESVLAHHPTPTIDIFGTDAAEVGFEIEHNAHTVEVPGCGGESLHLPLPPHGAWLHMSREDVREFGKAKFVAANFLDIYGRFFRWLALLIAAVTSSYSLSFLYLFSLG